MIIQTFWNMPDLADWTAENHEVRATECLFYYLSVGLAKYTQSPAHWIFFFKKSVRYSYQLFYFKYDLYYNMIVAIRLRTYHIINSFKNSIGYLIKDIYYNPPDIDNRLHRTATMATHLPCISVTMVSYQ